MRAVVHDSFGSPDVLEIREIEKPTPADDEVLVRVRAASVNPADWYGVMGRPWVARPTMGFFKPKETRVGVDFAGTVEAVGKDVTQFRPGDEVFGGRIGAFAEEAYPLDAPLHARSGKHVHGRASAGELSCPGSRTPGAGYAPAPGD